MPAAIDFTGQRFGRLVAVRRMPSRGPQTHWLFRCDCGVEKDIDLNNVRRGVARSCGCLHTEQRKFRSNAIVIHGAKKTPEYAAWRNMKARCLNPNHKAFKDYGGRGITVCERWLSGEDGLVAFQCFLADMGSRPAPGYTLERLDNEGHYGKANCCWATLSEQARNRRNTRRITAFGETLSLTTWAERYALSPVAISKRLDRGIAPEIALAMKKWSRPT